MKLLEGRQRSFGEKEMNGSNYPLVGQFVLRVVVQKKKTSGGRSGIAVHFAWNVATGPDHEMDCCYWQCVWATQCLFLAANGWLVVEVAGLIPFIGDSRVVSRCESDIIKSYKIQSRRCFGVSEDTCWYRMS